MSSAPLWVPSSTLVQESQLTAFAAELGFQPPNFQALHSWSINNREEFWRAVWRFASINGHMGKEVLEYGSDFFRSQWFSGARLNFAENLLRFGDERSALISVNEAGERTELSYAALRRQVAQFADELLKRGIKPGDRIACWLPNIQETIVAMLGTAAVGGVWSSCSPDFGVGGTLDRFEQIAPKLLIACDSYRYNGRFYDTRENVASLISSLSSLEGVLWKSFDSSENDDFARIRESTCTTTEFVQLPFDHPLYIMFSSGTTGKPKCIVHGAGGTLLQHVKEHRLHTNIKREDVLFFFTTTGWMMWNWLVSGLASGCTLVLYDGSPLFPQRSNLMDLIDQERISVFGVGAKYISSLEKVRVRPMQSHDLGSLRSILSTGSPLAHESFEFVYSSFKKNVWLASISGGTDIISCFVLGNPWSAVHAGEIQGAGLGMAVDVFDEQGKAIRDQKGELVCTRSFPSTPIGFWNDSDGHRYRDAYFDRFKNIWAHGDFAEVISKNNGYVIHGRSDTVLNPGGVRIGTAEIYRQVESLNEIKEALCVGQEWENDTRVVLFVVMNDDCEFDSRLLQKLKARIRVNASPRHVPHKIIPIKEIPVTRSGKIAELAVREVIHGRVVKNTSALANPESLRLFRSLAELAT